MTKERARVESSVGHWQWERTIIVAEKLLIRLLVRIRGEHHSSMAIAVTYNKFKTYAQPRYNNVLTSLLTN